MKLSTLFLFLFFVLARPDPVTINYFAKIVSVCTGEEMEDNDTKSDKLFGIMTTLKLSDAELDECTDKKSIRNTCRKVVRHVFKIELGDPTVPFGKILKEQASKINAIRRKLKIPYITSDSFLFCRIWTTYASS